MFMTSPHMKEINDAVTMFHQGDRQLGLERLRQLWERLSTSGAPVQISTLAHFLADAETDPAKELEWDLRALEAATGTRDAEDLEAVDPEMASFLPSLHLSVADGYRQAGDPERARRHLAIGASRAGVLADDGYGQLIRSGLRRLQIALSTL